MDRLATSVANIKQSHYPVVVIGSGYGGAIAASRLARAGQLVCLLERGREFAPGEFPDTEPEALAEIQLDLPGRHLGSRLGLYDIRFNPDLNVFLGCGLGGTSLVNANVALRAEPRVLADVCWPAEFRADLAQGLEQGYAQAEAMLKPTPYPETAPALAKLEALAAAAQALGVSFYRPPIVVTFQDGVNHVGVAQQACTLCGDCVSGCNYGAKNTTAMNYLPDACNHGAELYTQAAVQWLERRDGRWLVHYQLLDSGRERFQAPTLSVSADIVILAAGALGSTEILLRSKAAGLSLSAQVGQRFTGNGDVLGFGYNNDQPIHGIGYGHRPAAPMQQEFGPVGPCITGVVDARQQTLLEQGLVIEEGTLPGPLASQYAAAFAVAARALGRDTDTGLQDAIQERYRELESLLRNAYYGAMQHTQTLLVMSHDDGAGRLQLVDDRLRVEWPDIGHQPHFAQVNQQLEAVTRATGGTYLINLLWSKLTDQRLITVHPLGGCVMAESAENGVVNHKGQVFAGIAGSDVYDSLYVCDGAVMPRSLGVNPLLTISAVAERACALLAAARGWSIDYTLPSQPRATLPPTRLGLRFSETMTGAWSPTGAAANSPFSFTVTVVAEDLDELLHNPQHAARLSGTAIVPALSTEPLTITQGEFNLLTRAPDRPDTVRMHYRLPLTATDGGRFYGIGHKEIHNDKGLDIWADTTTLYLTVHDGADAGGAVLGQGILQIRPTDFLRELTTLQVTDAANAGERLLALARFGRFFAGSLFDLYGGLFARPTVFDPTAPPRKRRPLRVEAPAVYTVITADQVQLRLTRYQGGGKGPVLLTPGLGVSSRIFAVDTIETNLVEYLFAHGYDVWLLDYRASIDLPAALVRSTADDIASQDYPAAIAKVRELTGAATIQVVAHCFGAVTFCMALLKGLAGVRAVVFSQIATHARVAPLTRLKAGLYLPNVLDRLGVTSLTAYVDTQADWWNRLYDSALRLYPAEQEERCSSPVCRRITFMYAPLYEHDRLNVATHETLHELFGVANIGAFEHLALIARRGQLVDAQGEDVYLPQLDRLALPIAFIHGAENECFLPESTELSFNLLRAHNGPGLYSRHVIPGYGHIDCIFGQEAVRDVYPLILQHLEATA